MLNMKAMRSASDLTKSDFVTALKPALVKEEKEIKVRLRRLLNA